RSTPSRRHEDRQRAIPYSHGDGQGGIRTLDALAGIPVFETGGFNRSPTCPTSPSQPLRPLAVRRTGRDSNPRNGCRLRRFPSLRLKPLGHPSRHNKVIAALPSLKPEFAAVHLAEVS